MLYIFAAELFLSILLIERLQLICSINAVKTTKN